MNDLIVILVFRMVGYILLFYLYGCLKERIIRLETRMEERKGGVKK